MMKIYIYANGGAVLIDDEQPDHAAIGDSEVVQVLDATEENVIQYIGIPKDGNVKTD